MDIVADSLVRIKNGYLAQKDEVLLPYSKLVSSICDVLKKEGYIASWHPLRAGRSTPSLTQS
jgi:small subunit ribosomal protein S8